MAHYGVALSARNPGRKDSKIHAVAVDEAFGLSRPPIGMLLTPEAHARTLCGLPATSFMICARDQSEGGWKRDCRMYP
jgi:hypothetical protein